MDDTRPEVGLHLLGVSVHSAPAAVRERLALDEPAVRVALRRGAEQLPGVEVLVLATCNRTELVVVGATDALEAVDAWHRTVLAAGPTEACPALAAARYHLRGREAVRHLARVACGLESSVLGDNEIVGQLRRAAQLAGAAGTLGPGLRRVLDHALMAAKRARARTDIGVGGAGVGSATASVVLAEAPPEPRVLLLGAGDAAQVIARELVKRAPIRLAVANRNPGRAGIIAERFGAAQVSVDDLDGALLDAHVVVAATAAPAPVLTAARLHALRQRRPGWSPLVVDVGMPRNVEPVPGLHLVALDSLAERTERIRARRAAAVPAVEEIVAGAVGRWERR
jgi:glutamyl-tRNA reductase